MVMGVEFPDAWVLLRFNEHSFKLFYENVNAFFGKMVKPNYPRVGLSCPVVEVHETKDCYVVVDGSGVTYTLVKDRENNFFNYGSIEYNHMLHLCNFHYGMNIKQIDMKMFIEIWKILDSK